MSTPKTLLTHPQNAKFWKMHWEELQCIQWDGGIARCDWLCHVPWGLRPWFWPWPDLDPGMSETMRIYRRSAVVRTQYWAVSTNEVTDAYRLKDAVVELQPVTQPGMGLRGVQDWSCIVGGHAIITSHLMRQFLAPLSPLSQIVTSCWPSQ